MTSPGQGTTREATHDQTASRARLRSILTLAAGLGLGFLIAVVVTGRGPAASSGSVDEAVRASADTARPDAADPPDGGAAVDAASGRAAVEGFVAAEIAGDLPRAFAFLSTKDREEFGTAAGWEAAHADLLPQIKGFEPGAVEAGDNGFEFTGTLTLEPGLDEVVGLVPATADVTWVAVEDGSGRWGVDLGASTFAPMYPPEGAAVDAAVQWARMRQQCDHAAEYADGLVGTSGAVDRLCGATGAVDVGPPQPLDDLDASAFQAAFGDDVTTWARVVSVTAPVDLRVVLAPVGDDWLVIGALPATR